jgi:GT2 family glycosyltransferase
MSESGEVAVLVLNYNGKEHLQECFGSLEKLVPINDYKIRIICVDNGSTDGSLEYVGREFPWVEIIAFPENYGFAGGYNRAIEQVTSEYISLLNNDTVIAPDWIRELVVAMKNNPEVAICGGKILSYFQKEKLEYAGGKFTIIGNGYAQGMGQFDDQTSVLGYTGTVLGSSMLIKREKYMELGGFDERYFAYGEESDLCWRAWLAGYKVLYVPSAVIFHKYGSTGGGRRSPFSISLYVKNRHATLIKNLEPVNIVIGILISVLFEIYRMFFFLWDRDFKAITAVFVGLSGFIRELPGTFARRRGIQLTRQLSDAELYDVGALSRLGEAYREYKKLGV